jgi:sec-independent protein translocase protein TatC
MSAVLVLGFGLVFQLPIFVYILTYTGLVEIQTMKKSRPIIIIAVFVLAAILIPPDVISQLAMAIPSIILFEISLWFASIAKVKKINI